MSENVMSEFVSELTFSKINIEHKVEANGGSFAELIWPLKEGIIYVGPSNVNSSKRTVNRLVIEVMRHYGSPHCGIEEEFELSSLIPNSKAKCCTGQAMAKCYIDNVNHVFDSQSIYTFYATAELRTMSFVWVGSYMGVMNKML